MESLLTAMRMYGRHGFVQVPRFDPYLDSETPICMARQLDA